MGQTCCCEAGGVWASVVSIERIVYYLGPRYTAVDPPRRLSNINVAFNTFTTTLAWSSVLGSARRVCRGTQIASAGPGWTMQQVENVGMNPPPCTPQTGTPFGGTAAILESTIERYSFRNSGGNGVEYTEEVVMGGRILVSPDLVLALLEAVPFPPPVRVTGTEAFLAPMFLTFGSPAASTTTDGCCQGLIRPGAELRSVVVRASKVRVQGLAQRACIVRVNTTNGVPFCEQLNDAALNAGGVTLLPTALGPPVTDAACTTACTVGTTASLHFEGTWPQAPACCRA